MILYANDGIRINKFFYKCILFLRLNKTRESLQKCILIYAGDISSFPEEGERPLERSRASETKKRLRERTVHNNVCDLLFQVPICAKGDKRSTSSREQ